MKKNNEKKDLDSKIKIKTQTKLDDDKFWYLRSEKEVIEETNSSLKFGLTESEAERRLKEYGLNSIIKENKFNGFEILWKNINSILIYVLISASLISFFSGEMIEFVVIWIIIFFTITLSFIQEYRADKSIKALSKLTAKKVEVLRDGQKKEILADHLVVGDIVYLKRGAIVPADIRILESNGLTINESILTGESNAKSKISSSLEKQDLSLGDRINIAFSGTSVNTGNAIGVVVEIGLNSEIGKISKSLASIQIEKSPLQKKIDIMSKKISYLVIFVCFSLFIIMKIQGYDTYAALILIGAVAVSGIPESFPLALTMSLTNGINKMAKQNALVKDLSSVETLGTTTVICTDKTGTLTENKMRVSRIFFSSKDEIIVSGQGYEPLNKFYKNEKELKIDSLLKLNPNFFNTAILCNDSFINFENNEWKISGEPTEGALLSLAKSVAIDEIVLRERKKRVHSIAFDPSKKFMISVNIEEKGQTAYLKGAAEKVLAKSSYYRNEKGHEVKLTAIEKKLYLDKMESYSAEGFRVLFLASKKLNSKYDDKHLENDFVFEGFVAIEDPIREDVYGAVKECQSAGIRIIMITGDYKTTATHIGKKLQIVNSEYKFVFEGSELDKMSDKELDDVIDKVAIFSRATPDHKLRIVSSLQRKGEIVAMTGDGVNDAPALKKANIGIAMGKSGTEVARESANMILTDDNFATIVKAVKQGRTIYSNIRRFVYYLLAGNFTEVAIVVVAVIFGFSLPLTALMILFVNVITSTIPAMALSIEPTHEKVMRQKPRNPKDEILSSYVLSKIFVLIPFMVLGIIGLYLWELHILGTEMSKAMTIAFATLICFELFHVFNARRMHTTIFNKDFFSNKILFISQALSFSIMLLVIYSDFGQTIFKTVSLGLNDWIIILFVSSSVVWFSEIIKLSVNAEFKEQKSLQGINIKLE